MKTIRDIDIRYQSTPALWAAYREGLCWCEECAGKHARGLGRTPLEALCHLLEQELDAEETVSRR